MCRRRSLFSPPSPPFQDIVSDPVFGRLEWQGYGDGDWWLGKMVIDDQVVQFRIGGTDCPNPLLVVRARELADSYRVFKQEIETFLQLEIIAREELGDLEEVFAITQLSIECIVLFPPRPDLLPDEGYVGEFIIFYRQDRPEHPADYQPSDYYRYADWRCDLIEGQPTNLCRWL